MKLSLALLLCLLLGCKEIDDLTKNETPPGPKRCDMATVPASQTVLPDNKISVIGLKTLTRYRIVLENKILWDECTRASELPTNRIEIIPEVNTSNGSHTVFHGFYYELIQNNTNLRTEIFELDSTCQPVLPATMDQLTPIDIHSYSYSDGCGGDSNYEVKSVTIKL